MTTIEKSVLKDDSDIYDIESQRISPVEIVIVSDYDSNEDCKYRLQLSEKRI